MDARRLRPSVTATASQVLVKPFVVMAARALGPGPTRLKLVRLAHHLNRAYVAAPVAGEPTERAA